MGKETDQTTRFFFWSDLNGSNFFGTVRYLFGKKLAKIITPGSKLIQWNEGQPYEKCINRALRESKAEVRIYGCQLFLYPPELLNIYFDPNEIKEHLADQILVNGKFYLDHQSLFKVGASLRYAKLFSLGILPSANTKVLTLFSYFPDSNSFILELLKEIPIEENDKWALKFHPSTNVKEFENLLPEPHYITYENLYDLFPHFGLVIGSSSGSLVEAVACGLSVIVAAENGFVDYTYLPEFCKGILWDVAYDVNSFIEAKERLLRQVKSNSKERIKMIQKVRSDFFCEPTEKMIINTFELGESSKSVIN
ncbi:hypothetical protein [Leptospira perdikensis]|uniref:Glycosyltransferase family 1 protein n=1 Tax=Leptospira perdikensis TaxID=2484948 RepID=A0A4R9JN09_9LEPT|nr:hypothetical protein [Leptospira perdikensis]TGL45815.1 hypothetical protein EHQ49_00050 [Leptospira perdikensis]